MSKWAAPSPVAQATSVPALTNLPAPPKPPPRPSPGAVHSGVPAWLLVLSMVLRRARDSPKSHTYNWIIRLSRRWAGEWELAAAAEPNKAIKLSDQIKQ